MNKQIQITSHQSGVEQPIDFRHYLYLAWHWLWLFLLAAGIAAAVTYLYSRQVPPIYESTTTLLVMDNSVSNINPDYSSVLASQSLTKTYADMITNPDLLQEVITRLKLPYSATNLATQINASPLVNTQMIEISVQDTNPILAAQIANTLVQVFLDKIQNFQSDRLLTSKENLQAQLNEIDKQEQDEDQQRQELNAQLLDVNNQIKDAKDRLAILTQPTSVSDPADKSINLPVQQVTAIAQMAATSTAKETARIAQAETARGNLESLQALAIQYRQMIASTDQLYYSLKTNHSVLEADLENIQSSNKVIQVNLALPSVSPVGPKIQQNTLIAALLGLFFAAGVIFGLDALDDSIRSAEDVVNKLGLPVLGVIYQHKINTQLVTIEEPRSSISESFRSLRTNIQYANVDEPIHTLLVTSAVAGEGKTIVSANLAVVFALNNHRLYYVDADLRHPTVHKKMNITNNSGLSQLVFKSDSNPALISQSGNVSGLNVITCGDLPPNPAELLGSKKMQVVLDKLKMDSDLVLFDTPPVLAVSDAAILAPLVDGVLFVVKPGKTTFRSARQALEQLEHVNAHVIGVVLNEMRANGPTYSYYYNMNSNKSSIKEKSMAETKKWLRGWKI